MSDLAQENRRRALLLVGGWVAVVAVVVWIVLGALGHPIIGLVAGLLAGVAVVAAVAGRADGVALARAGAVPADERTYARFHNVVEGLCVASGVPKPRLYVVDDPALNTFAIGRDARRASLVATSGLLEGLSRIELEGVVAHELSHVKALDILPATLAVTLLGVLTPALVPRVLGPRRENVADVTGVSVTRYPPGLISALEKLRDDSTTLRSSDRAIAHLWIEAPAAESDRPPLEERIQALREL